MVQGKDLETAENNYQEIISQFPHLDKEDVKRKCYKDAGLYITWLEDHDRVRYIEYPREWCEVQLLCIYLVKVVMKMSTC